MFDRISPPSGIENVSQLLEPVLAILYELAPTAGKGRSAIGRERCDSEGTKVRGQELPIERYSNASFAALLDLSCFARPGQHCKLHVLSRGKIYGILTGIIKPRNGAGRVLTAGGKLAGYKPLCDKDRRAAHSKVEQLYRAQRAESVLSQSLLLPFVFANTGLRGRRTLSR